MSDENVGGLVDCPKCGAPCNRTVNMRGGDHGWSTSDEERAVYKYALSAHGQPVVDDRMVRGWRNRFISAQTELNQRANGNDYELARAYAEATANEYEEALIAALGGNDHG